jgi:hypothetical protein
MTKYKNIGDIPTLHDLRSIPRTRRSAKPQLPTTAILNLYMARNERDRLIKERIRLLKRKHQVEHRLGEVEDEMRELLAQNHKAAHGLAGEVQRDSDSYKKASKVVLEY